MAKTIILTLNGNIQDGVNLATATLWGDNLTFPTNSALPPKPELKQQLEVYESCYKKSQDYFLLGKDGKKPTATDQDNRHNTYTDCCNKATQLSKKFNEWLLSSDFSAITNFINRKLDDQENNLIVLRASDPELYHLPWEDWDLLTGYRDTKLVFGGNNIQKISNYKLTKNLKILVIVGHGVTTEEIQTIKTAFGNKAKIKISDSKLLIASLNGLFQEDKWNIIFYLGHGETIDDGRNGIIKLNDNDWLKIDTIKEQFKQAVKNGLELAIFMCCDGIGIAQQLFADPNLPVPEVVVMRNDLPTAIAPTILNKLIADLTQGKPPSTCVWELKKSLKLDNPCNNLLTNDPCELNDKFPGVDWLPVIFTNRIPTKFTWPSIPSPYRELALSLGIALFIIVIRYFGVLQTAELHMYDQFMRSRPLEPSDPRLVLVEITNSDGEYQEKRGFPNFNKNHSSLADGALTELLNKINPYQPRVIGLDIYRTNPIKPETDNLIAICKSLGEDENNYSESPPPGISPDNLSFSNITYDFDRVTRRQILAGAQSEDCPTDLSFGYQIFFRYLENVEPKANIEEDLSFIKVNDTVFKRLNEQNPGGYLLTSEQTRGFQMLINYRSTREKIGTVVTLQQILETTNQTELKKLIENKIILIGSSNPHYKDLHPTPLSHHQQDSPSNQSSHLMPGVEIHAHMISQMLSAVFDHRPLIWWLPEPLELLWIALWASLGYSLNFWLKTPFSLFLVWLGALFCLYRICYGIFLLGGWLPLVPAFFVFLFTTWGVLYFRHFLKKSRS